MYGIKCFENSTNNSVASRFFARSPMTRWIVRIWEVVDRFLGKPFWFFQRIFSASGQIWFRNIINLISSSSKSYDTVVLCDFEVTFLREMKDTAFRLFFCCVFYTKLYKIEETCREISLSSIIWAFSFPSFIFFPCCVKFFLCNLDKFTVQFAINYFFGRFIFDYRRACKQIFEMFFLL